jgi:ferric iron reductase protein FhuF
MAYFGTDGTTRVEHGMGRPDPLLKLDALGPYFVVSWHTSGKQPQGPWRSMAELVEQSEVLATRIQRVRRALAHASARPVKDIDPQAAASLTQLGLVARVVAVAIAVMTVSGRALDARLEKLWWQDVLGGGFPLSLAMPRSRSKDEGYRDTPNQVRQSVRRLLDDALVPISRAVAVAVPIPSSVLWGNVASAVNSAWEAMARRLPDEARHGQWIAEALLSDGRLGAEWQGLGPEFRRSSCCLLIRTLPEYAHGVCADCPRGSKP